MTARTARLRRPRTLLLSGAVAAALAGAALAPSALAASTSPSTSASTSAEGTAPAAPADGTAPTPPADGTAPAAPTDGTAPTPPEGGPDGARSGGPGGHGGPGGGPGGEATITAVDDDSITVSTESGTETTYAITGDTTVSLGGGPGAEDDTAAVSDLEVGQRVHVRTDAAPAPGTEGSTEGTTTEDSTADGSTATAIEVHLPSLRGTVAEVTGSGFTLVDRDGFTRTVTLADGATVTDAGAEASLSDLAAGDVVTAVGEVDADGTTLLASSVRTGESAPVAPAADGAAPAAPAAPVAPEASSSTNAS